MYSRSVKYILNYNSIDMFRIQIERWFSIQHLNSYFDVDTSYVIKKLLLIIFPFFHSVCELIIIAALYVMSFINY